MGVRLRRRRGCSCEPVPIQRAAAGIVAVDQIGGLVALAPPGAPGDIHLGLAQLAGAGGAARPHLIIEVHHAEGLPARLPQVAGVARHHHADGRPGGPARADQVEEPDDGQVVLVGVLDGIADPGNRGPLLGQVEHVAAVQVLEPAQRPRGQHHLVCVGYGHATMIPA